jgi:hypothetical protein
MGDEGEKAADEGGRDVVLLELTRLVPLDGIMRGFPFQTRVSSVRRSI